MAEPSIDAAICEVYLKGSKRERRAQFEVFSSEMLTAPFCVVSTTSNRHRNLEQPMGRREELER